MSGRSKRPRFVPVSTYEEVLSEAVERLRRHMDRLDSVFLAGCEWVPGVSDIDIIVFAEDQHLHELFLDGVLSPEGLEHPDAPYLLRHHFGLYPLSVKPGTHFIGAYTSEWRLLLGEEYRFPRYTDLPANEARGLVAAQVFGLLYKKLFQYPKVDRTIGSLERIGWLWSFTYTIHCARFVAKDRGSGILDRYIEKVTALKHHFVQMDEPGRERRLDDLSAMASDIIFREIPRMLSSFLTAAGVAANRPCSFTMPDISFRFRNDPRPGFTLLHLGRFSALEVETWSNLAFFLRRLSQRSAFRHLASEGLSEAFRLVDADPEVDAGIDRYGFWLNLLAESSPVIRLPHPYSRHFYREGGVRRRLVNSGRIGLLRVAAGLNRLPQLAFGSPGGE